MFFVHQVQKFEKKYIQIMVGNFIIFILFYVLKSFSSFPAFSRNFMAASIPLYLSVF